MQKTTILCETEILEFYILLISFVDLKILFTKPGSNAIILARLKLLNALIVCQLKVKFALQMARTSFPFSFVFIHLYIEYKIRQL